MVMAGPVTAVSDVDNLKSILAGDPVADAREAILAGKLRFVGVAGYALRVPGIDTDRCLVDRKLVDILPATTDYGTSEQFALYRPATVYADKYNHVMKRAIKGRLPMQCVGDKVSSK